METSPKQYRDDHSLSVIFSEVSVTETEKEQLLESSGPLLRKKNSRVSRLCYFIAFLLLSNVVSLSLLVAQQRSNRLEPQKSWLPPEIPRKEVFKFNTTFGEPPSNESSRAWNALMPVGRGFVIIRNDTALPDLPGLNQSMAEQHAMVSVFHQLHCLYMTREGYFSMRAGNIDEVNHAHLSHCWDYLRQTIMCFGDTSLEWVPAPPNDVGSTGWGYQHTCRDFSAIFSWAEKNRLRSGTGIH